MWYRHYTDLAYRTATGRTAAVLRRERGAGKEANASDYLTTEELAAVQKVSGQIAVLIEAGMTYREIKDVLNRPVQAVPAATEP